MEYSNALASPSPMASPLVPGNIDLTKRPVVRNPDGSISTVRSIGVTFDDGTYLLPTVIGNRVVSDQEAVAHFRKTGQHLGVFKTPAESNAYAEQLHRDQEKMYTNPSPMPTNALQRRQ